MIHYHWRHYKYIHGIQQRYYTYTQRIAISAPSGVLHTYYLCHVRFRRMLLAQSFSTAYLRGGCNLAVVFETSSQYVVCGFLLDSNHLRLGSLFPGVFTIAALPQWR